MTILYFISNMGELNWRRVDQYSEALHQTTQGFRREASLSNIVLSSYDSHTLQERVLGGCTAPLRVLFDQDHLSDDPACMTRVAQRLDTDWLLSGFVDPDGDGFVVEAQLVSAQSPDLAREIRFRVGNPGEVSAKVHAAWLTLTATSQ